MVIVDNYLFKDATKKIDIIKRTDSNILALLQQLIPKRAAGCSIPLEIMIITVETDLEPGKIRDHITNHLKKHLHIHNLEVSIVLIFPTRYHDRHFLTQFFYLTTGKGFNYFKDNLKLDAHLSTYLSISPWAASRSSDSDSKTFGEIARLMLRDLGRAISQKKAGSVGGQTSRLIDWAMKT
ncbi:MAG: hypothetical protein IPP17_13465 [Bacteroidetes bacterium]|nr:hypothetical protein [Bacteroidota bacterium]